SLRLVRDGKKPRPARREGPRGVACRFRQSRRVGQRRATTRRASDVLGRILAADPVALELLIARRLEQRTGVAGPPADHLVGLAAELAPLFPPGRPRAVGLDDLAVLLVEEQGLALAVRLDAHVDGRDRGVAEVGRAEGL